MYSLSGRKQREEGGSAGAGVGTADVGAERPLYKVTCDRRPTGSKAAGHVDIQGDVVWAEGSTVRSPESPVHLKGLEKWKDPVRGPRSQRPEEQSAET